jgi:branched-subunit amino acid transport protein
MRKTISFLAYTVGCVEAFLTALWIAGLIMGNDTSVSSKIAGIVMAVFAALSAWLLLYLGRYMQSNK